MATRREFNDRPPAKRKRPLPAWALALVVVVGLLTAGGAAATAFALYRAVPRSAPTAGAPVVVAAPDPIPVRVGDLMLEWEQNPAAAARKYKDQPVEVEGFLTEVSANVHRQTTIRVAVDGRKSSPGAHVFVLGDEVRRQLEGVRVGDRVWVVATATGDVQPRPWLVARGIR